jgi:hypothetical protein
MKYCHHYHIFIFSTILFAVIIILLSGTEFIPKMLQTETRSVAAQSETNKSNFQTVEYFARFNCGTINDDNGPLRPGKYDSDITIFNKKNFPLSVIWKAIESNQQNQNNFKILNIQPESLVSINCAKIFAPPLVGDTNLKNRFTEGVLLMRINTDNGQLTNNIFSDQGQSIIINKDELGDLVNVDVVHTVNTLSNLNKEAFYIKIDFSIGQQDKKLNDSPESNLTAIFQIEPNKIINPLELIQQTIGNNHTNVQQAPNNNKIVKIIKYETFSNSYTDNHAITYQKINPTFTN